MHEGIKILIFVVNLLTAVAQLLTANWKSTTIPSINDWYYKVKTVYILSKFAAINKYYMGSMTA